MPDIHKHIAGLIIKRLDDLISPEELQELEAWAASHPERQQVLADFDDDETLLKMVFSYQPVDWRRTWNRIAIEIPGIEPVSTDQPPDQAPPDLGATAPCDLFLPQARIRSPFFKPAVALVLLLISTLGYWYTHRLKPAATEIAGRDSSAAATPALAKTGRRFLDPAGSRATLQLADGRIIDLAAISAGSIATQGNTRIVKTADGTLQYIGGNNTAGTGQILLFNTISTPRAGYYGVLLPDGTRVSLNASSTLRYPTAFSTRAREVALTGEAYFEVSKQIDALQDTIPFIIHLNGVARALSRSGGMDLLVTGTRLNVYAYEDDPYWQTTLLAGLLSIIPANSAEGSMAVEKGSLTPARKPPPWQVLHPGQQYIQYPDGRHHIQTLSDTADAVAWKNGKFSFKAQSVHHIMRQVARWYDANIIYKDSIPGNFNLSGTTSEPVTNLLGRLEKTDHMHFAVDGRNITISR